MPLGQGHAILSTFGTQWSGTFGFKAVLVMMTELAFITHYYAQLKYYFSKQWKTHTNWDLSNLSCLITWG